MVDPSRAAIIYAGEPVELLAESQVSDYQLLLFLVSGVRCVSQWVKT